jgi:CRISPR system Cascade subunit CasA
MPEHYSLVRRAWLPVALQDGTRAFVRPCDMASACNGQSIVRVNTGRPDGDISLTEFLIGLVAVALGPKDRRQWAMRYQDPPTCKELELALRPLEPALVLDGEGARFFQDLEALDGEPNRVEALLVDGPGSNTLRENADHFVKRGRTAVLSRAGAAIALATLQTSAPSGGAGHRTSLRGGGPLTTLVVPAPTVGQSRRSGSACGRMCPTGLQQILGSSPRSFLAPSHQDLRQGWPSHNPERRASAQAFFAAPQRIWLIFRRTRGRGYATCLALWTTLLSPAT